MKFAVSYARRALKSKSKTILSFFFHARGSDLESSTLGFYRSILLQILGHIRELETVFDSLNLSPGTVSSNYQWSVESLKALLEQALLYYRDRSFVCFVELLDESDENEIRDMISFFEHICESAISSDMKIHVCFSSRHYPHISLQKGINLILDGHEGHNQDVIKYLSTELKIGQSKVAEKVRQDVEIKAAGIFMWVILVVDILNKEYDSGRVHMLQRRVKEIPGDLYELFRDILTRDSRNQEELILCIQWVLFSKRPLGPEELYFAIMSGFETADLSTWDPSEISESDMRRFILDSSKGLAEITVSTSPKVQFIHESVNDFFLKENGLGRIMAGLETNFQGQSHEQLKRCCFRYINLDAVCDQIEDCQDLPRTKPEKADALRKRVSDEFPFLEYAAQNVLHHSNIAEGLQVEQRDFIQHHFTNQSCFLDWVRLDNLFEKARVRRHNETVTLLYILAEHDLAHLIQHCPSVLPSLEEENERYGLPLFAALVTRSYNVLQIFRDAYAEASSRTRFYSKIEQVHKTDITVKAGRDWKLLRGKSVLYNLLDIGYDVTTMIVLLSGLVDLNAEKKDLKSTGQTLLSKAAAKGSEMVVKLLLETNRTEINLVNDGESSPLWYAAQNGNEKVVKLLLEIDEVEVNTINYLGTSPLMIAAEHGQEEVVKLLLKRKELDVNLRDRYGPTPLGAAAKNGHEAVVKLLLNMEEVDVNKANFQGESPLNTAIYHKQKAVVKLLLNRKDVDVNFTCHREKMSPLHVAVFYRQEEMVKLLLDREDVDVNNKGLYGKSPLFKAAENRNWSMVKLLLERNDVDINTKTDEGKSPLAVAAENGDEITIKLLLERKEVDINSNNSAREHSPLISAVKYGHKVVTRLLLEKHNIDVNIKDRFKRTPLFWASYFGYEAIVGLLLETGQLETNITDSDGNSPLSLAAEGGSIGVVIRLLATGQVDINAKNNYGVSPLLRAINRKYTDIVELLQANGATV